MDICIVHDSINKTDLHVLANEWHQTLVKGVADISHGVVALGGEWHMDANTRLIEDGSSKENLWGFNIYPNEMSDMAIEYISLINIRPAQENRGMEIESEGTRMAIRKVVARAIPFLKL